jgi:hypothetical protein
MSQLEHCTTVAAVEAVRACGPTVGGMSPFCFRLYECTVRGSDISELIATITAHHLYLTFRLLQADPEEAHRQRRADQGRYQRRPEVLLVSHPSKQPLASTWIVGVLIPFS